MGGEQGRVEGVYERRSRGKQVGAVGWGVKGDVMLGHGGGSKPCNHPVVLIDPGVHGNKALLKYVRPWGLHRVAAPEICWKNRQMINGSFPAFLMQLLAYFQGG